jgi:hypothetical protein
LAVQFEIQPPFQPAGRTRQGAEETPDMGARGSREKARHK